jgi:hypothetical protein
MQKWKENLNIAKTTIERYKAEVLKLSQDFEKKNSTVTLHVTKFTVVKNENQQYILPNEEARVSKLTKSFKEWQTNYPKFQKDAKDFLVRVTEYDIHKIMSEADKKISDFREKTELTLSELAIETSECWKLCLGKLEFSKIKECSGRIVTKARSFGFGFNYAMIKYFGECVSDTIDKDYNTLCAIKINLVDTRNNILTALFDQIAFLTNDLNPLQHHLPVRVSFRTTYVFDETAISMDKKNSLNLVRLKNPEKELQSCYAIAHLNENISQALYLRNRPTWILVDKTGREVKVLNIDTPYRDCRPFQDAIRITYRGY